MAEKRFFNIVKGLVIFSLLAGISSMPVQAQNQELVSVDQLNTGTIIPEPIGQLGGFTITVAWQNNIAYVGIGLRLYILDVSTPSTPILIGKTGILPGVVFEVIVSGTYAYVANGDAGFYIFDVSDPTNPLEIGRFEETAMHLAVQGNYAYIDDGRGFRIIDISDPMHPTQVSVYHDIIYGIAVSGNYAYVSYYYSDLEGGVRIIDISDPAAPVETGFVNIQGQITKLFIAGDYAYAAEFDFSGGSGLSIIDISNPTQPVEISSYSTPGRPQDVVVVGKFAYVADDDYGLRIIDIGNPQAPFEIGFYDTPGVASSLSVAGSYAYVADFNEGLRILDISNADQPIEAGFYKNTNLHETNVVAVQGKYAYIGDQNGGYYDGWTSSLRIIDISNPASPIAIGFYDASYGIFDLDVEGGYAYLAAGSEGLRVIDISDTAIPYEVGHYICYDPLCPFDYAIGVKVVGNFVYIATNTDGVIVILNISNPTAPQLIGFYDTPGVGTGLDVQGNLVYFADYYYALRIIDTSDRVWPKEIGYWNAPGAPIGVTVSGNYAYVADGYDGLRIVDVSNPAAPTEVGYYNPPSYAASHVTVAGKYAYVNGYPGLRIVDISNPTSPTEVGAYGYGGGSDVAVVGNLAYLANGYAGLVDLRLLTDRLSAVIPVSGGSLASTDGSTNLIFLSGAFTETVNLTYRQLLYDEYPGYWVGIDHAFDISAVYSDTTTSADLAPGQTFTVTVTYSDSLTVPAFEDTLGLFSWNGTTWEREPSSTIDTVNNLITATPNHLSLWAILGDTNRVFIPITRR